MKQWIGFLVAAPTLGLVALGACNKSSQVAATIGETPPPAEIASRPEAAPDSSVSASLKAHGTSAR